jgi:hypothetical protein
MGWKSTIDITRREAIDAIIVSVGTTEYDRMSNDELEILMDKLRIGDEVGKPYFGHNFNIN